jgi:Arc/MetJ-type ribon-helix-helix transcriptional regulator
VKLITLWIPEPYLSALDELVSKRYYPHRAEAIRAAIRDLIIKEGNLPQAEISAEATEKLALAIRTDEQKEMDFE